MATVHQQDKKVTAQIAPSSAPTSLDRKLMAVATAAALAGMVTLVPVTADAQQAVANTGTAHDANTLQGSGGINSAKANPYGTGRNDWQVNQNALIYGNVGGGKGFRGQLDSSAANSFRSSLGSDDLFSFRANSFGSAAGVNTSISNQGRLLRSFDSNIGGPTGLGEQVLIDPNSLSTGRTITNLRPVYVSPESNLDSLGSRISETSEGVFLNADGEQVQVLFDPLLGRINQLEERRAREQGLVIDPTADPLDETEADEDVIENPLEVEDQTGREEDEANPDETDNEDLGQLSKFDLMLRRDEAALEIDRGLGDDFSLELGAQLRGMPGDDASEDRLSLLEQTVFEEGEAGEDAEFESAHEKLIRDMLEQGARDDATGFVDIDGNPIDQEGNLITEEDLINDEPQIEADAVVNLVDPFEDFRNVVGRSVGSPEAVNEAEALRDATLRRLGIYDDLGTDESIESQFGDENDDDSEGLISGEATEAAPVNDPAAAARQAAQEKQREQLNRIVDRLNYSVERRSTLAGQRASQTNVLMQQAEAELSNGEYFNAERTYKRVLRLDKDRPMARIGLAHSMLGAGMARSATLHLRRVFDSYPELIAARYDAKLLPTGNRLNAVQADLQRLIAQPNVGPEPGIMMAYLGYQIESPQLIRYGLAVAERQAPQDPLLPLLYEIWGDDAGLTETAEPTEPATDDQAPISIPGEDLE